MNKKRWEHFPHEADMGVRGIGNSKEEAFEQAAIAMSAVITDPAKMVLWYLDVKMHVRDQKTGGRNSYEDERIKTSV